MMKMRYNENTGLEKAGTQALEAEMKRLGDEAGKYAGEKLFQKKAPTPKPHEGINERPGKECRL